jgi:hypothetical protein
MKKITLIAFLALAFSLPSLAQMAGQSGRPGTPGTPGGTDTPGATVPGATSRQSAPSGTHDTQMHTDAETSGPMKSAQKMGKKMTITGCISEKDGRYMLMSIQHPDGMELLTSENLKPHVGHKVKVTGIKQTESSMNGGSNMAEASRPDAAKSPTMNAGSKMSMTSMKMVAESCASSMDKSTK